MQSKLRQSKSSRLKKIKTGFASFVAMSAVLSNAAAQSVALAQSATVTPIKHVIVIIGENRSFDHVFATYQPVNSGETVLNLLSKGIVNADGTPGPNYHTRRCNSRRRTPRNTS